MSDLHIYRVVSWVVRDVSYCQNCEKETTFCKVLFGGYCGGSRATCTNCGDSWNEDGREDRPFARYWRRDAIAEAEEKLKNAVTMEEARAGLRAEVEAYYERAAL